MHQTGPRRFAWRGRVSRSRSAGSLVVVIVFLLSGRPSSSCPPLARRSLLVVIVFLLSERRGRSAAKAP
jgi:hypothetical protein